MNIFQCGGHCLALRHSPTAGWDCDSFEFNKQDGTCRLGTFDGDVGQGVEGEEDGEEDWERGGTR